MREVGVRSQSQGAEGRLSTEILILACLARGPVTLDGIAEVLGKSYATAKRGVSELRAAGFRVQDRISETGDVRSQRRPLEYWLDEREVVRALRALAK